MLRSYLSERITGTFNFYDLGMINGKHTYEVQMKAVGLDGVLFTRAKLAVKPKNNRKYLESEIHPPRTNFANNAIQYQYDGDGPSKPTVRVKANFDTTKGGYSIPSHVLSKPIP